MKRDKIILAAVASLLLSGCGIYGKYRSASEVPQDLYGAKADDFRQDSVGLGGMQWMELFTDPYLQSLVERGLENNADYLTAQLRVEEAEASLRASRLSFLPSFALSPQGTISSFDGGSATKTYTVPVTASWEVDIFGKMRNAKLQTKALYAQTNDYRQAVRSQIISGIANLYYTLLMLDEQLLLTRQTEQAWSETVRSARALMNAGQFNEAGNFDAGNFCVCRIRAHIQRKQNKTDDNDWRKGTIFLPVSE